MTGRETTIFYSEPSGGGGGTPVIPIATTTQFGIAELASDAEVAATVVVQANDSRLPSPTETAALVGTGGTPSGSNPYVTQQSFGTIDGGTF